MNIVWNDPYRNDKNNDTMVIARVDGQRVDAQLCEEPVEDSDYLTCRNIAEQMIRDAAKMGPLPKKVMVMGPDLERWRRSQRNPS